MTDSLCQKQPEEGAEGLRVLRHQVHGQAGFQVVFPDPPVQRLQNLPGELPVRVAPDGVTASHRLFQCHKNASAFRMDPMIPQPLLGSGKFFKNFRKDETNPLPLSYNE